MHPSLKNGWHEVLAQMPSGEGEDPTHDLFVGRFVDEKYHLLGYRPVDARAYFSARDESRNDLGIVELPEGKSRIKDMAKGDIFNVRRHASPDNLEPVKYLGRR